MAQLKKWEANAQKPGIPDGVQVTDYTGQNHKTTHELGVGGCAGR